MLQKHKKHADIARPNFGFFGRNEWAFLGTNCDNIKKLTFQLSEALSPKWEIGYVDADHKGADEEKLQNREGKSALTHGAAIEYTDKISFHQFSLEEKLNPFQYRPFFNGMDAVFVNGNHFAAKNQVVVIDPKKEDSLQRKLERLANVSMILLTEGVNRPYDFLKENLLNFDQIPIFPIADFPKIQSFFSKKLEEAVPPLNGLALVGGKSRRMGTNKGKLDYHGIPQQEYLMNQLSQFCNQTYLSCRPDQAGELAYSHDVLPDTFLNLGPMGAILSAFRQEPDAAWLVVACDLPLLDKATLQFLVDNRNPSALATAFRSSTDGFPEPLAAIWEPKSYPALFRFLSQGYSCPRKVLINSAAHLLESPDPNALMNVNTPQEAQAALKRLEE